MLCNDTVFILGLEKKDRFIIAGFKRYTIRVNEQRKLESPKTLEFALDRTIIVLKIFFASGVGFPLFPEILYFITMILHSVSGSLWEMSDSNPKGWCATNEPPHLQ